MEKSRAKVLAEKLEAREGVARHPESGRPIRTIVRLSYLDGRQVDVPFWSAGDQYKAEARFQKPLPVLAMEATGEFFLCYCALARHPDEAERPRVKFEDWVDTVDQVWDAGEEEPDPKG